MACTWGSGHRRVSECVISVRDVSEIRLVCAYAVLALDLLVFELQGLGRPDRVSDSPLSAELLCARPLQPVHHLHTMTTKKKEAVSRYS